MGFASVTLAALLLLAGHTAAATAEHNGHRVQQAPPALKIIAGYEGGVQFSRADPFERMGERIRAGKTEHQALIPSPMNDGGNALAAVAVAEKEEPLRLQIPPFGGCNNFTLPIANCNVMFAVCVFVYHGSTESKADACAANVCGTSGWRAGLKVGEITQAAANDLFAKKPSCAH